jgi:DNA polymerase III subunit alpha
MSDFIHLHNHTEFSLLDGACRIDRLVQAAKDMDMSAVAITDHGNLFGAVEFYKAAKAVGVKPIIGTEAYISFGSRKVKKIYPGFKGASFHLVLLAKNEIGYRNLIKLSSESYLGGFYYKPRIDQDILKEHSEGIIALSACLQGEVPAAILKRHVLSPEEVAKQYLDIFGPENFYLEIHDHDIGEESIVRTGSLALSKKMGIHLVATNDCHYINAEDYKAHDVLLCMQTQTTLANPDRFRYQTNKLYFRSPVEMKALFNDNYPGSIENTLKIAEQCDVQFNLGKYRLPVFKTPDGSSPDEYLRIAITKGFVRRSLSGKPIMERLNYEYKVIKKAGFSSYFLIVADILNYARSKGIFVGPGRGSVAGSMVAFCLGITEINPITHKLLFERFLNPDRVSMPDIDMDFPDDRRGEILEYLSGHYGAENVAQIVTFGTLFPRSLIRDISRALGKPPIVGDTIAKLVPQAPEMTIEKAFEESPGLREAADTPDGREIFLYAKTLEGLKRHAGMHAAGVVISPDPVSSIIPLYKTKLDEVCTQFDMYSVEDLGFLKFDILGLKTLRVIDNTLHLIATDTDPYESYKDLIYKLTLDMPEVLAIFAEGRTAGIFQFESPGMQNYLKQIGVKEFNDLVVMNALYRPGPIDSGLIDEYVKRRLGLSETVYDDPRLKEVLGETFGIQIFQEQVMGVSRILANFTLAQADTLRKAIGKKNMVLMLEQRKKFIDGAVANKVSAETAESVWEQIQKFARYSFNRAHSAGYALIAYQTAWLKAFYPSQFMAAIMTTEIADQERMSLLAAECRQIGLKLLPPDVNTSDVSFTPVDNKTVRVGLSAIKGIGDACAQEINRVRTKEGAFKNIFDFIRRVDRRKVSRGSLEHLVEAGAFDSMGMSRRYLFENLGDIVQQGVIMRSNYVSGQGSIMSDVLGQHEDLKISDLVNSEWETPEKLEREHGALGIYVSGHPLDLYAQEYNNFVSVNSTTYKFADVGQPVSAMGILREVVRRQSKRGNWMLFFKIEDYYGTMECFTFDEAEVSGAVGIFGHLDRVISLTGSINQYKDYPKKVEVKSIILPGKLNKGLLSVDINSDGPLPANDNRYSLVRFIGDGFFWEV